MKQRRWRRWLGWGGGLLLLVFAGLWIAGPLPVEMGPYVQNVTRDSAQVCWFGDTPRRVEVRLRVADQDRVVTASQAASVQRLRVAGLHPGTRYDYRLHDADSGALLGEGSFPTAPADSAASFSFVAVGDSGRTPRWFRMHRFGWGRIGGLFPEPGQWAVARWMAARQPDLFVHLGDVIYSHDQLPAYQEVFFRPFAALIRRCPLIATFGNHDMHRWQHPEFFRLFQPSRPLDPAKQYTDFSHTFTWGPARFVVVDVFWQKWQPGSPMRAWLEQTLRDNELPRLIVIMHHPAFSDEAGVTENALVQKNLWPLYVRHGVDLIVSGDSHNYQRFRPVDGVTQVIVGTGGKSVRPVAARRVAHHEERPGFLLVKVTGTRLSGEFWAGGAQPLDTFTVAK